jgi:transposase-like protein
MKHQGEPRTITLDGFEPSHSALGCMGMRNEFNYRWENSVKIRSCQYLNNIVEQDHRRVKFRLQPMLGFRRFYNSPTRNRRSRISTEDSQETVRSTSSIRFECCGHLVQSTRRLVIMQVTIGTVLTYIPICTGAAR